MRPSASFPRLASIWLLAAALNGCGGGSAATSAGTVATPAGAQPPTSRIAVADPAQVNLADGSAIASMADAMVVGGDHIVVRSPSDATVTVNGNPVHPKTRLTLLDADGKLVSSTDYGFTLAAGYTGEWLMLPSPDGFLMVQAASGTKMLHFDKQAKLAGTAMDLYPAVAPTSTTEYAAAESAGAVDGNGFWLATTFSLLPVTDKTTYILRLCKFDFSGRQLTPPFQISSSAVRPQVAAAGGVVLAGWLEGGGGMLALWPKGAGAPVMHSLTTGGAQPYPVAMTADGKMGVLWNGKATATSPGGLMGVFVDNAAAPVLDASRTDLTQESLSARWGGSLHTSDIDAHTFTSALTLASIVNGPLNTGEANQDLVVIGDYGVGAGALSAEPSNVLRFSLSLPLGDGPVLRQMVFSDHAILLLGNTMRLRAMRVTRKS